MENFVLTERDLEELLSGKKAKKNRSAFLNTILKIIFFICLAILIFILTNFSSIKDNLLYEYQNEFGTTANNEDASKILEQLYQSNNAKVTVPDIANNSLYIPAIEKKAPITWNVPNTDEEVAKGLENGVVQIEGTALPGEVGNVFITGHSSNYIWAPGNYKNIFALLNKLVVGDIVHIKYNNTDYIYKVYDISVVSPDDLSVMQSNNSSILTLMTCTPVGTSLNRLIIKSKQIYPDPSKNKKAIEENSYRSLPSSR